jgi:hypothetical protein
VLAVERWEAEEAPLSSSWRWAFKFKPNWPLMLHVRETGEYGKIEYKQATD